jgi:AraC-like DNA-binding protein
MHAAAIYLCLSVMIKIARQTCFPRLNAAGRVRCEPGWHLGPDWSRGLDDYDLWFVWAGRGQLSIDGTAHALAAGTCVWMRPGRRYEAVQDPAARLGVNYLHFELHAPGKNLPLSDFTPPFEVLRTRQVDWVDGLMQRVIALRAEPDAEAVAPVLFGGLLMELEREHAAAAPAQGPGIEQHHRDLILRAAAQIRENPGRVPPVAELARAAGYSVDHFSRVFLKVTGQRPQDYVITARVARARQLLAESDLTVGMIAEALGFQDIFYFSRRFRRETWQTPTEFRRGLRRA